jgi:hypothetical protein
LPYDVLADDASAREVPMLWLLLLVQLSTAGLLLRGLAVAVPLLSAVIAFVCSTLSLCRSGARAPLAQCKIVLPALPDGAPEHLAGLWHDDERGFLGGRFFFPL